MKQCDCLWIDINNCYSTQYKMYCNPILICIPLSWLSLLSKCLVCLLINRNWNLGPVSWPECSNWLLRNVGTDKVINFKSRFHILGPKKLKITRPTTSYLLNWVELSFYKWHIAGRSMGISDEQLKLSTKMNNLRS